MIFEDFPNNHFMGLYLWIWEFEMGIWEFVYLMSVRGQAGRGEEEVGNYIAIIGVASTWGYFLMR